MSLNSSQFSKPYRCAIYFVPEVHSAWWQAGSAWLGRCAATGQSLAQPRLSDISPEAQWATTSDPRRYGWHATLKAPFQMLSGEDVASVVSSLHALAKTLPAFDLPALQVSKQDGFLALRPVGDVSRINSTAAACVKALHRLAAPLSEADVARRRQAALSPEQDRLLLAWGYPYVFDEFQFHLSLTGRLDGMSEAEQTAWQGAAQAHFHDLPVCRFDRLALFVEPTPGADFQWVDQVELLA